MTKHRLCLLLNLVLACFVTVECFSPTRNSSTRTTSKFHASASTTDDKGGEVATFRYSPASLLHIQNVDLPPDYSRPWTMEKTIAIAGALALGGILGAIGEVTMQNLIHVDKTFFVFGAVGAAAGYSLLGGSDIAESEKPINGGLDAKLIADKPIRLKTTLEYLEKQASCTVETSDSHTEDRILPHVLKVHEESYVQELKKMSIESDVPRRLNPLYSRTLIDQHSYDAAIQAVGDWVDSVDRVCSGSPPSFLLVRPPSHHACRGKGKGGCLLNSVAIAAMYALDKDGVHNVAILDMDAHHGNGIAHCVQNEARIRCCSIHEDAEKQQPLFVDKDKNSDDPRSPSREDVGPLGNILNVNLKPNTGWDNGYSDALQQEALPFLCENEPQVLLVAAGFDALDDDWSSSLQLHTDDYSKLGSVLKQRFGNQIAFGLEGGYSYQNGKLAQAICEFVKPWQQP